MASGTHTGWRRPPYLEVCDFAKRGFSGRGPVRKQGSLPRTSQTPESGCPRQPALRFLPLDNSNRRWHRAELLVETRREHCKLHLKLEHFRRRYIAVEDIWIPLGESAGFTRQSPLHHFTQVTIVLPSSHWFCGALGECRCALEAARHEVTHPGQFGYVRGLRARSFGYASG